MHLPRIPPHHLTLLITTPVITVIAIAVFVQIVYGHLTDWDFLIYVQAVGNIANGQLPWTNGVEFYYPPLAFIPILAAYLIAISTGGSISFAWAMWAVLIACNIVTTFCVYYIGLKLYDERTAFIAAMLNATAISVAYYTICRFDSFPACLAMLAVLATLYEERTHGYLASVLGGFAKVWPLVLFPFLWIYNAKDSSLIEEGKKRALLFLVFGILAAGAMIWCGYTRFLGYANLTGTPDRFYCNTIPYVFDRYFDLLNIDIDFSIIAIFFRILTVVVFLSALYLMYRQPKNITRMVQLILVVLVMAIMCSAYRSPQYIVWFTPFAALLLADDIPGIVIFTAVQVMSFIEYPVAYGVLYVNGWYYYPDLTLLFFTGYFLLSGILLRRACHLKGSSQN